jgi:malonyl-ACP O-methyltransferase BioC
LHNSNIENNFTRAAKKYNQNAILQKIVATNLVEFCSNKINHTQNICDLGSGTGFLYDLFISDNISYKNFFQLDLSAAMLAESNHHLNINSDILHLPIKNNKIDIFISSLAMQWVVDLDKAFLEIKNSLTEDGYFIFSIISRGSLPNIRAKISDNSLKINNFISKNHLKDIVSKYFSVISIKEENIMINYDSYYDILRSIKNIGAEYSFDNHKKRLGVNILRKMMKKENISDDWKIIYVLTKKIA